jgi:hypothetical protein
MLSTKNTNLQFLAFRIQKLQSLEFDQYNTLKSTITTIATNANPVNIGKKIFTDFIDVNVKSANLKESGLLAVTDFFIGKILGKYRSASKYMLSIFVQKLTSFLILKSNK